VVSGRDVAAASPGVFLTAVNDHAETFPDETSGSIDETANFEKLSMSPTVYEEDSIHDGEDGGGVTGLELTSSGDAATLLRGPLPVGSVRGLEWGTAGSAVTDPNAASRQIIDEDRSLTFEQIHRKYEKKIYNLILRLVGDPEDAEDLTVETFMNAYRSWGRFRGDARVSTWLHQIAVNNCKNRFKQKDRRRDREPVSLDDAIDTDSGELSREVADWRDVPERRLLDKELARQIQRAVEALAPEYRMVLVLAQMEDMSYEEIARVTRLSVPAVKTRLHRARNMMRRRLEPYYRGWTGRRD